ncbi:MAG TPA: pyridoxal-dependent decarboxylase [Vicinamibacteria bacterium]|nr:pyridoxal-dependent decarboxylase [Vicinamibacteria bacterium]
MSEHGDIDLDEFRAEGHRLVDWIARYLEGAERLPVLPRVRPGDVRAGLPASPPAHGEPLAEILADVERRILPGLTHWNHPAFFAYFANSSTAPAILGEMLAAAFNTNAMLWKTGPAATELEVVVLDWVRQMTGLPEGLFGVIQDTASAATLVGLAAAREAVPGLDARRRGMVGQARLRMYASEQAHSSVEKAGIVLGVGQEGLRKIPVDAEFRMDPKALGRAVAEDRASGWTPFAVTATVGTTSSTSVDPVADVAEVCAREGLWLHVDAAYAGSAALVPELRWLLRGCERADSLVLNPHKWLFVPVDLSAFYTRRPEVVKAAFSLVPEYLRTAEESVAPNLMDYGVSLGRRFRALKLWMVIRAFGAEGLAARIREHVRLAQVFRSWVEADPAFDVVAPSPLSVVCFRWRGEGADEADRANERILEAVNLSGEAYLSHTKLAGRTVLRLAIGNVRTEERHVRRAWELIRSASAGDGPRSRPSASPA